MSAGVVDQRKDAASLFPDIRTLVVARVFGLGVFLLTGTDLRGGDLAVFAFLLLVASATSALVLLARSGSVRRWSFEAGLLIDLALVAVMLHLTGGDRSPLMPLLAVWAMVGALSHGWWGGAVYAFALVAVDAAQAVLERLGWVGVPPPPAGRVVPVASVLALLGATLALGRLAHQVAADRRALEGQALRDPLTGLWNRRAFDRRLVQLRAAAERHRRPLAIVAIDLDHFKAVNDRFGHAAGDEVLRHLARLLTRHTRTEDEVFRIGGEEFAVLVPDLPLEGALAIVTRIRESLREAPSPFGPVTFSAGVALDDGGELVARADRALYRAKAGGRNATVVA